MDEVSEVVSNAAAEHPHRRDVSPEELKAILEAHRMWVHSQGNTGKRAHLHSTNLVNRDFTGACLRKADLIGADLSGATLLQADLTEAFLTEAILREANLTATDFQRADLAKADLSDAYCFKTNFQSANLYRAKLIQANLEMANLRDAKLQHADLTGVLNLMTGQLGGTNVSGAQLPSDVAKFEGLANVKELSDSAQNY